MTDTKLKLFSNKKTDMPWIWIIAMMALTALTGLFNQTLLSLGIIVCCGALLFCEKLYLAFPFMLFYSSFYGVVLGVAVFRIYTLLVLGSLLLKINQRATIKVKFLLPLLVYIVYIIAVMIPAQGFLSAMFILLDIFAVFILVVDFVDEKEDAIKNFFKIYVIVAMISFFTGQIATNTIGGEYDYLRFMATFEDPNYMGFFFTIAVFSIVTLKLFNKRIRYFIVIALYAMILTSLSITAIVLNSVLWLFYLVITKKLKWHTILIIALVVIAAISLFNYGIKNPDIPVLGDLSARIDEKLISFKSGDMGDATTNRSDLFSKHLNYYIDLPIFNVLFGGIPVNTRYIHADLGAGTHNEYLSMLLNVGFIGALIMFVFFFSNMVTYLKEYKKNQEDKYLFFVVIKAVWVFYAVTLTMFLDFRFMFFFLM